MPSYKCLLYYSDQEDDSYEVVRPTKPVENKGKTLQLFISHVYLSVYSLCRSET